MIRRNLERPSLLRQLDALLRGVHPALLGLGLLALGDLRDVALLPLDILAHVVVLGPAFLPRDHSALGLGNLLADALGLVGDAYLENIKTL